MFEAVERDRPDVLALLLDLGVPLEIADRTGKPSAARGCREQCAFAPRHSSSNAERKSTRASRPITARQLAGRRTATTSRWSNFLSRHSRNIWTLCFRGYVDRVREVLAEDPEPRSKVATAMALLRSGGCRMMKAKAMEIVELLLAAGADPAVRSREGKTAVDWALKRGMATVAARLAVDRTVEPPPAPQQDPQRMEKLARDILTAHESGDPAALQSVQEHFGHAFTWDELRDGLRTRQTGILGRDPGTSFLNLDDVRRILAREKGFDDWEALVKAVAAGKWVS